MSAVQRPARFGGRHMVSLNKKPGGMCEGRQEDGAKKPHSLILEEAHHMPKESSSRLRAGTAERNIESLQLSIRSQPRRKHCCGVLTFSLVTIMSVGTVVVL